MTHGRLYLVMGQTVKNHLHNGTFSGFIRLYEKETSKLKYVNAMMAPLPRQFRKLIASVMAMIICSHAYSQSLPTDDGILHWEVDFRAGLNTDGYQFGFGIIYFPIQYVGFKAQIGLNGEIEEIGDWLTDDLNSFHDYSSYKDYTTRFIFNPTLVFRTPRLVNWKNQDAWFSLFAEPGFILSPGALGSKNAQYINWDFKGGINMQIDCYILTLGYGISNFSLYSGFPDNHWGAPDNDNYITHLVFLGAAYKF